MLPRWSVTAGRPGRGPAGRAGFQSDVVQVVGERPLPGPRRERCVFRMAGTGVRDPPKPVLRIDGNRRSRCSGIRTLSPVPDFPADSTSIVHLLRTSTLVELHERVSDLLERVVSESPRAHAARSGAKSARVTGGKPKRRNTRFDLIAATASAPDGRKAAGVAADGLRLDWLPGQDSNLQPRGYKTPRVSAGLGLSHPRRRFATG